MFLRKGGFNSFLLRPYSTNSYNNSIKIHDKFHLRWLDPHLRKFRLKDITRDVIDRITHLKLQEGVRDSRANRVLEVIRAILRKAAREWEWLDKPPAIRLLKEENRRIR